MKEKNNCIVVNIYGGAGAGKSTLCHGVCEALSKMGIRVEYVPEFMKQVLYEDRDSIKHMQDYILSKQHKNLETACEKNMVVVTDAPMLNSIVFTESETIKNLAKENYNKFRNLNFFLDRGDTPYDQVGRYESHEEALEKDKQIRLMLDENVSLYVVDTYDNLKEFIINVVSKMVEEETKMDDNLENGFDFFEKGTYRPISKTGYTNVFGKYDYNISPHTYVVTDNNGNEINTIHLQEGNMNEVGMNGVFMEDLLNICLNELKCFQNSRFKCKDNDNAIKHIEQALSCLQSRQTERKSRGVQGKLEP